MKKTFCDHCGKEIKNCNLHFIAGPSLQLVNAKDYKQFTSLVRSDFDLCKDCADLLANQVREFLNLDKVEISE